MQCTLHIPHLIPPRQAAAVWDALPVPVLKTILARARHVHDLPIDQDALTCELFGMARGSPAPAAPLLARYDGLPSESGHWLCATPVHVETRHHGLVLHDPAMLHLTALESTALAATLAGHLQADALALHAAQPGRWYLQCDDAPAITTTPLSQAVGRDIDAVLPQGSDALRWHRLMTELQMLLHTHPVNDAREAAGQLPINWVWLWGGGVLPARSSAVFQSVWSDDALTQAVARHAGAPFGAAPAALAVSNLQEGHHFFSLHALTPLWQRGDMNAWSAAVTALEQNWFRALDAALNSRQISRLTLLTSNQAGTHRFVMGRWDRFKIFNKNKYL